jgi:uncharacterized protein YecT (DUF1311 family)
MVPRRRPVFGMTGRQSGPEFGPPAWLPARLGIAQPAIYPYMAGMNAPRGGHPARRALDPARQDSRQPAGTIQKMSGYPRFAFALAAVLWLAAAGAAPAAADDPAPGADERAKLTQCLDAVRKAESDPRACIGVVADPCLEQPDQATTMGTIACITRETRLWSEFLAERSRLVFALVDDDGAERLREVEGAWSAYRDARCALGEALFPGGSLASVWAAECMLQEIGRRAIEMGTLHDDLNAR